MTNSARFIIAYNKIDSCLRNIYNFSSSITFADLIRRCADKNQIVRSNETLLGDYARLRNAIIHKSTEEIIIAEPHTSVTEKLEQIAGLICTPPKALSVFGNRKVTTIDADTKLKFAIKLIRESHFSNIPVYKDTILKGILNNKIIVKKIGEQLGKGNSIDEYLNNETAAGILEEGYFDTYYKIFSKKVTLENLADAFFANRKLIAVLITETGERTQRPICIITAYDLMEINDILDNYQG